MQRRWARLSDRPLLPVLLRLPEEALRAGISGPSGAVIVRRSAQRQRAHVSDRSEGVLQTER